MAKSVKSSLENGGAVRKPPVHVARRLASIIVIVVGLALLAVGVARYVAAARIEARYKDALILMQVPGRSGDAASLLEGLRADAPTFPNTYTALAKYYDSQGDPQHALALLQTMKQLGMDGTEMHIQLAEAYVKLKDSRAVVEGKSAVAGAPNSWRAHMALMAAYGYTYDSTDAIAELMAAERLTKPNVDMIKEGAEYASSLYDYPIVEDQTRKWVTLAPSDAEAWYLLGLSLASRPTPAHLVEAETDLQKSVQLSPQNYLSRLELGDVYLHTGRPALARQSLELARLLNDQSGPGGTVTIEQMQDRTRIDHLLVEVYEREKLPALAAAMRAEDDRINGMVKAALASHQAKGMR